MKKIAIIGSGIAGLACAYKLHKKYEITLFEKNSYLGGHAHTVKVESKGETFEFDTGFMVYNEVTYPELTRLFRELEVQTTPTSMSFSVQHSPSGLEYCGSSYSKLFVQRKNLFRPQYYRFLLSIKRFNEEAPKDLEDVYLDSLTLSDYVAQKKLGDDFLNLYLLPMSGAVWSAPAKEMLKFPAKTLLRFFYNHGFLGMYTQHPWRTVTGGSKQYVKILCASFQDKIQLNHPILKIMAHEKSIEVCHQNGRQIFDSVILACPATQALSLLPKTCEDERNLLSNFRYQNNPTLVHQDTSVMPQKKKAWASWNYRTDLLENNEMKGSTHYWMNSLQHIPKQHPFFVSLNAENFVDPEKILLKLDYEHPLFDQKAIEAQKKLP
ncbi:MAG: FAD-dependent oxidoreductase, partial [Deltaproteobacteria bacterium]|nr:FAD-dependent oxidoreductase [Deltaproteobacteria bacterium]